MNRKWIVLGTVAAVVVAFAAGVVVFTSRSNQEVKQAVQSNGDALVRPHSPIFGNPAAKVTIVEFFDPSCETCRAFYPIVKRIVNASFGQHKRRFGQAIEIRYSLLSAIKCACRELAPPVRAMQSNRSTASWTLHAIW